jgi:iron complex outermembrane receptor protein
VSMARKAQPRSKEGRRGARSGEPKRAMAACSCVFTTLCLLWVSGAAWADALPADAPSTGELKQLSLEDLMNVRVTSVSKQPQKLLDAPSAIQVITGEEIRRSGATSLPEALRLADNLQVAQINAHDWAISARGFNANLANKLLVLIDGRAVYTPLYGGVLWNVQDVLLEDIDRIEVISGPGGTLWGANAVNGVINVITKSAAQTQGAYASVAGGSKLEDFAAARYGAELTPDVYLRFYGKYFDQGDEETRSGANAEDSWHMLRGGFRMDIAQAGGNALTFQGDSYHGGENDGAAGDAELSGGDVLARWTRSLSAESGFTLQTYYDHTYIAQPFAAAPPAPYFSGFPAASLMDTLDTYDLDFQYHLGWGSRQKIVWGLGYRATHEADQDLSVVRFAPPTLNQNLYEGFVQDEIAIATGIALTIGSKLEHNDYTGFEVEPSVRGQWNFDPKEMVWAAISRAVRTPSRYDHDLEVPSGLIDAPPPYKFPEFYLTGNPDFKSETLIAYEIGYRAELASRISGSVATYYNDYNDLRSTTATPTTATYIYPYPVYFQNNLEGDSYGVELAVTYQLLDWWRLHAGYDVLQEHLHVKPGQSDATGATNETADPQQQFAVRSSMDLPHDVQFNAALRWVDELHINNGPTGGPVYGIVPSYFELDSRVAWHVTGRVELSVAGFNLLHAYHTEYGYPSPAQEQIGRSIFGRVACSF